MNSEGNVIKEMQVKTQFILSTY